MATITTAIMQRSALAVPAQGRAHSSRQLLFRRQQHFAGSRVIPHAQPAGPKGSNRINQRVVQQDEQPAWSDGMAAIQALMSRVQEQLQAVSNLRPNNPALARELKAKAESHLELLMSLAESQHAQHIQGKNKNSSSNSGGASNPQQVLHELQVQLDLERQAALTAASKGGQMTKNISAPPQQPGRRRRTSSSSNGSSTAAAVGTGRDSNSSSSSSSIDNSSSDAPSSNRSTAAALQQQVQQAQAAAATAQERLAAAEAQVASLQQQLADTKANLKGSSEELSEHRELQMAYDKQCQDLYRLRMQLQLVRTQGNDTASLAAAANKQHKQDLAWLMDAHRKEIHDAHTKNQELIHQVQQMRLKLLEQEQLVWSLGGPSEQQQQQQQQPPPGAEQQQGDSSQALQQQQQEEAQLQELQASADQLAVEKQQLMSRLQDSQREQAVLLVELQNLREAAAAAAESSSVVSTREDAEASARAEAAVAAELALKVQLQETQQQRDGLVEQVQALQTSLQDAQAAAAEAAQAAKAQASAAAAAAAAVVPATQPVGEAAVVAAGQQQQQQQRQLDAAAAVEQLKVVKVEMAGLRVQLADARRELKQATGRAAAAEAALQQQAAGFESRLARLQSWYNKQAAVVAQLRRGKAPKDGQVGFNNTNKFWVRQELLFEFLRHWVAREGQLQQQEGFLGLQVQPGVSVTPDGGVDVTVSSLWESIPAWEAWSKSSAGTQQHMPAGVYQYVPPKGEGFPEAFVPFRDYEEAVNAKY